MVDNKKTDTLYQEMLHAQSDAVLTYIGKKLIEEDAIEVDRLMAVGKENPMPQDMDDRLFSMIQKEKKISKATQRNRWYRKLAKVCALVILFVSLSGITLYNTVDAFKYTFDNFVAIFQGDHIDLFPERDESNTHSIPENWSGFWYPDYLPDGYHLDSTDDRGEAKIIEFQNSAGDSIQLHQQTADGGAASIDGEGEESGIVRILDRYDGYWSRDNGILFLTWLQADHIIQLKGPLLLEEALQIAENLNYQK